MLINFSEMTPKYRNGNVIRGGDMKKGIITEIDWSLIGAYLANEDDENQIKFFKAFCKEMESWDTALQMGVQLVTIAEGLTSREQEILDHLTSDLKDEP